MYRSVFLCSFVLFCVQVHPPRHFAQRERRPEYTPTKTFEKKSENLSAKSRRGCLDNLAWGWYTSKVPTYAGVLELADETDSKSVGGDTVWVRPPSPAFLIPKPFSGLGIFCVADKIQACLPFCLPLLPQMADKTDLFSVGFGGQVRPTEFFS